VSNFEDELRRSLQNRADDVTPDPAMFSRVQARIRRGRTFRLAVASVAGALAVAVAAVAAPALIDRRIELLPGPVVTAPAPEATAESTEAPPQSLGVPAVPMVYTDGATVFSVEAGQAPVELIGSGCPANADCDMEPVRSVTARPGVAGDEVTAVSARSCAGLESTTGAPSFMPDTCPTSVLFSPDGGHLAWVGRTAPDGVWALYTVNWTDEGAGDEDASFELPVADPTQVSLEAWTWDEESATTAKGHLIIRARRNDIVQLIRMPIERQGDGALAVTWETGGVPTLPDHAPLAFTAAGDDVTYTMEAVLGPDGPADAKIVRRTGTEVDGELGLPPELFNNTNPPFDEFDLWLSAAGDTLVYGNSGARMAWSTDWSADPAEARANIVIDGEYETIVHADLSTPLPTAPDPASPTDPATEAPPAQIQVDVYFGMAGNDACVASQAVPREVEGPGVARAALTQLLQGPTSRESNEGIETPFTANTAGALNDITIVDGEARVDLRDFRDDVGTDSCTKSSILDSLDNTLLQFPTITSTRYSFDGDAAAFERWLGSDTEHPAPPAGVANLALAIRQAAENRDFQELRRLSSETSCTLSDQKEPCVPHWKQQEANGEDPLGTLAAILTEPPAAVAGTSMWVWPAGAAGGAYVGPRVGIDEGLPRPGDGTGGVWRYYVQEGG
jgi:hypothetical protein